MPDRCPWRRADRLRLPADPRHRGCHGGGPRLGDRRLHGHQQRRSGQTLRAEAGRNDGSLVHRGLPDERSAFRTFARDFPTNATFLVDTYDTIEGVRSAIDVIDELGLSGPVGIRLDSGDLEALARSARRILDDAGLGRARIVASGGLDEGAISGLVARGAPIDAYGVGTRMGVSADAPSLDSAYKLVAFGDRSVMKLSVGKVTDPGVKQVFRGAAPGTGDVLGLRDQPVPARPQTVAGAGHARRPPHTGRGLGR